MGLEKAIEHNKEHRKPYRGAKAIAKSCRNHGSDDWSKGNRTYKNEEKKRLAKKNIFEYDNDEDEEYPLEDYL